MTQSSYQVPILKVEVGSKEGLFHENAQWLQTLKAANAYVDTLMGNPALDLFPFLRVHKEGRKHIQSFHNMTKNVLDEVRPFARGPGRSPRISWS
jgi:hypothetical protein